LSGNSAIGTPAQPTKKREFVRTLPALILTAGLLVSLAACSPPVSNLADCEPVFPSGDNSNAVEVSGTPGKEPKVDFPTPLVAKSGQLTIAEHGEGDRIFPGQAVTYVASQFNAETGELVASSGYDDANVITSIIGQAPGKGNDLLAAMLACTSVGDRVVLATDVKSVYGDSYDADTIANGDQTAIFVFDVLAAYLGKANGWDQLPQAGFPSVVLAPDGRPGITVPGDAPPTDLRIATLKAGTGATVKDDSNVVLQYTGVVWETGTVFDSSWSSQNGGPALFSPDQVVAGFAEAIVGAKVGSQVIVVIPPGEEYGYPAGNAPAAVGEGNTMIFVIDILGIKE
jgi:FKBP-type peptidyl-prolyl cis-trans isomerase